MAIVDRIKKLMSLSHSDNVHEAAEAAAQAQRLMMEHKIEMADLSLNSNEKRLPEEVVETGLEGTLERRSKAVQWRISLSSRIAGAFNCKVYFHSRTNFIGVMGLKSDVETVQYLMQYFGLEIERLVEKSWKELKAQGSPNEMELPRPTTWKASFRDGAVHAIGEKLHREKLKNRIRTNDTLVLNNTLLDELKHEVEMEDLEQPAANQAALVLVRQEEKEREAQVSQKWDERFKRNGRSTLRKQTFTRRAHSQDGYTAGKQAGSGISYGGQRAGIAGSKQRIEG